MKSNWNITPQGQIYRKLFYKKYYQQNKTKYKIWNKEKRDRGRTFLNRVKTSPCLDCLKQYNPWVMQFDHRDPSTKIRDLAQMWNYSEQRLQEEINKCDLVCANCHAERTYQRRRAKA